MHQRPTRQPQMKLSWKQQSKLPALQESFFCKKASYLVASVFALQCGGVKEAVGFYKYLI